MLVAPWIIAGVSLLACQELWSRSFQDRIESIWLPSANIDGHNIGSHVQGAAIFAKMRLVYIFCILSVCQFSFSQRMPDERNVRNRKRGKDEINIYKRKSQIAFIYRGVIRTFTDILMYGNEFAYTSKQVVCSMFTTFKYQRHKFRIELFHDTDLMMYTSLAILLLQKYTLFLNLDLHCAKNIDDSGHNIPCMRVL